MTAELSTTTSSGQRVSCIGSGEAVTTTRYIHSRTHSNMDDFKLPWADTIDQSPGTGNAKFITEWLVRLTSIVFEVDESNTSNLLTYMHNITHFNSSFTTKSRTIIINSHRKIPTGNSRQKHTTRKVTTILSRVKFRKILWRSKTTELHVRVTVLTMIQIH